MFRRLLQTILWPITAPAEWTRKILLSVLAEVGLWERAGGLESLPSKRGALAGALAGRSGRRRSDKSQMPRNDELSILLDGDDEGGEVAAVVPDQREGEAPGWHGGQAQPSRLETAPGVCVECEATAAILHCTQCDDDYCPVCFAALHRKGKRAQHTTTAARASGAAAAPDQAGAAVRPEVGLVATDEVYSPAWFVERSKHIPLRLSMSERKGLRLLQSALKVCDYTDKIDSLANTNKSKARRVAAQLKDVCALLSGAVTAVNYEEGQAIVESRDFDSNKAFFRALFEVGRRHKIMNPDAMRDEYGKLIYLLQVRVDIIGHARINI